MDGACICITQLGNFRVEHNIFEFCPVGREERESYYVASVKLARLARGTSTMTEIAATIDLEAGVIWEVHMCLDTCFNRVYTTEYVIRSTVYEPCGPDRSWFSMA